MGSKIIGSGSFIPNQIVKNTDFREHKFFNEEGEYLENQESVIEKFKSITGIEERRYAEDSYMASDLATEAAIRAIEDSKIDSETLDYIIVGHNYGDVPYGTVQSDTVPSLASRVKGKLGIQNPYCVAYDLLFGCPGWNEGMIQAHAFIQSGIAKRCLVIGAETLSRVIDPHDRDSMIYADGAGAVVVEASNDGDGFLNSLSATYTLKELGYLNFGPTYNKDLSEDTRYIKMKGRKIYEFALSKVPEAMKACLDKAKIDISEVKKVIIHQANEKMDMAILQRFYKLYDMLPPESIMPMTIHNFGNSSVATIPTLFDLLVKGKIEGHQIQKGDVVLFASVGAGMNVNAIAYKI